MTHALAPAHARERIGGIGHRLSAAGDDYAGVADADRFDAVDDGLES